MVMRSSALILQFLTLFIVVMEADSSLFRLIYANSTTVYAGNEGLLLYHHGTVCDDYFNTSSAEAICKEMGFNYAKGWSHGAKWPYVQYPYSITLDDVKCSAPDWSSCTYNAGYHNCGHSEDVFLTCCYSPGSCPAGTYYLQSTCMCIDCPSDTFNYGNDACKPCPGSTTSKPGSAYCSCDAGMFWNNTRSQCESCPQSFTSRNGSLQCQACPSGSIAVDGGTSCSCPDGMKWIWPREGNGFCRPCSPGSYKNSKVSTCTICPLESTSQVGSARCICPSGKFWNETFCQNCSKGSVSQKGASQCLPCPNGLNASDTRSCICPVGTTWMWHEPDQGSCKPCPPGTYKNDTVSSCQACPSGFSSIPGSYHCLCNAGMFWNGTGCENCAQGLVSHEGSLQCMSCPQGSVALIGGSACSCPGGMVWDWTDHINGSCTPCLPGTYKYDLISSCQACPSGSTSISGSDYCMCKTGLFWNETRCDICAEGTASPGGSLHCLTCPPRSTSKKERTLCSCPIGKSWSWDDLGNGSCSLNIGLAFICTSVVLVLISLILGFFLISQKRKAYIYKKDPARVSFAVEGDIQISCDNEYETQGHGEDTVICQPGQEVPS